MAFYLKEPKASTSLIMMIIYDGQFKDGVFKYSTRERIDTNKWDYKNNWPKSNTSLNKVLREFADDAEEFMRDNKRTGYTRESLRDHLNGTMATVVAETETAPVPMVRLWEDYLTMTSASIKKRTQRNYKLALNAFCDFIKENKISLNIFPSQFDFRKYNEFLAFMKESYAPNTVAKYLKTFKRFIAYLEDEGIKIGFNKKVIEYKEKAGLKIALSQDKLDKLYAHKFVGRLNNVRWLFLLQCYTGFRVSDLWRICENIKGNFIILETQKVEGHIVQQPITKMVRYILEKYNYELPRLYDQDYNEGIKEIYEAIAPNEKIQIRDHKTNTFKNVFVHTEISSHDAVRTFITMCIQKGMDAGSIAEMTGKTTAVILKHYFVSSTKFAQEEMMKKFDSTFKPPFPVKKTTNKKIDK